ncbi:MAG: threonine--tRNA ligase [Microgenomates group bacterium]
MADMKDHRQIGREMDLFTFSDLVGSGLPLFTPKGTILRDLLAGLSEKLQREAGYKKVWIPHIAKEELYKNSGHWDKFGKELFLVTSQETDDKFILKPMSCPHHIQIYASNPRSYRDLPIRYYETTTVYRDEKSGELGGLNRVRSATQDDAHVFCTMDQVEEELEKIVEMVKTMYRLLDLQFKLRLSFRDSKDTSHYLGTNEQWKQSQEIMEKVAKKSGLEYFVAEGEAAFYAPKIDIMATDSQGREWQVATEQLDFVQPARFKISYVAPDGTEKTPIMIHKALLGSIERFLSVYIEHTQGFFPFWLAPVQVAVLPVSEKHNEKAQEVFQELLKVDMRVEINGDDKPLGAKIRETTLQKVPFMIIIGDKEMQESELSVAIRSREGKDLGLMKVKEFIKTHLQSI